MTVAQRRDIILLFSARVIRLLSYGFVSVVLALHLEEVGLSTTQIGLLLSLTLAGDAGISLWLTTSADRFGRRRILILGAALMLLAGVVFIVTQNPFLLMAAAIVGVISPSGNEIGPFLSLEQAGLTQLLPNTQRTRAFAWYNLAGSFATASGALAGGWLAQKLQSDGMPAYESYRLVLAGYASAAVLLIVLFSVVSSGIEVTAGQRTPSAGLFLGLHRSRGVVLRLSALFGMDAFAGGLIVQSMLAYWFHLRFGVDVGLIGSIFFGANILAGFSALLAVRLAERIGLINTMVFTHIPSSILLMLVPLMPGLAPAIAVLLLRFSISQMDVPTRQSYTMAVVNPDERSAAAGVTGIARSVGAAVSPSLTGVLMTVPWLMSAPFFIAGGLKIIYDVLLFRAFSRLKPPEEVKAQA